MKRRNTPTKAAVLSLLAGADSAMSHDMLLEMLEDSVDRATIYRILNRFCADGVVHRVLADDGKQYFALCEDCAQQTEHSHNHFHFRCLTCSRVECLGTEVSVNLPSGYRAENFNGVISGVCSRCG
ncbi:transcriptional repressor [Neolewinella lacunae]|uniref:Transcriptional repressor n=1 Tax=Neolewinella lacunae TaxID=1517758 RepID=A0A923T9Y4_9BACT|nr:transcriptional repressor [Neolewinella lacunae]MBC6995563.1 transcriptional repressor [Neolewinella lacunae]MDN3635599.1 transcriptional repressor [Neolewinella lacunae]